MISPDAFLAFWGRLLRNCGCSVGSLTSRAGLAETRPAQDSRRLLTCRIRGDSSCAGHAETRHVKGSRRFVTGRTRGDSSWGSGRSIGTWRSLVHCVTLVRITGTIWCLELRRPRCAYYWWDNLHSLNSGRCGGSYWTVEDSSYG